MAPSAPSRPHIWSPSQARARAPAVSKAAAGSGPGSLRRRVPAPRSLTSALPLRAVAAASLLAVRDASGVECAADDLVADAGQVADTTAAHEHDRVLLEVVALTRDVRGHLHTG